MLTIAACTGAASPISLIEGDDPEFAEHLLAAADAHARASRSHIFEVLGFSRSVRQILLPCRPYSRKYPASHFSIRLQTNPCRPFSQMRLIGMPRHSMAIPR
jgi:hypothetical protein